MGALEDGLDKGIRLEAELQATNAEIFSLQGGPIVDA